MSRKQASKQASKPVHCTVSEFNHCKRPLISKQFEDSFIAAAVFVVVVVIVVFVVVVAGGGAAATMAAGWFCCCCGCGC